MNRDTHYDTDCLVVGGGPAGLTATLYLQRFHRRVLLVDAGQSRALRIDCTHNLPGFPDGIAGESLLSRMREQVARLQGVVSHAWVQQLAHDGQGGFVAHIGQQQLAVRQVVLATGVVDHEPPLPGLALLRDQGLLRHCPICDGHEHTGQNIVVLGDGEHARAEAKFLRHYSPHVTLVGVAHSASHGRPAPDAGVRRLAAVARSANPLCDGGLALQLGDGSTHRFDVLYMAMGATPRCDLAEPLGATMDVEGNLKVDVHCRTSVPGLYAAGDVVSGLDQLVVATAQGAIAATAIHNSL